MPVSKSEIDKIDLKIGSLLNCNTAHSSCSSPSAPFCPFPRITGEAFLDRCFAGAFGAQKATTSMLLESTMPGLPSCLSFALHLETITSNHNDSKPSSLILHLPVPLSHRHPKNPSQGFSTHPLTACEISLLRFLHWMKSLESSPTPGRRPDDWMTALKPHCVCSDGRSPLVIFLRAEKRWLSYSPHWDSRRMIIPTSRPVIRWRWA